MGRHCGQMERSLFWNFNVSSGLSISEEPQLRQVDVGIEYPCKMFCDTLRGVAFWCRREKCRFTLRYIWRRVHHHIAVLCIPAHRIFKLGDGRHLGLIRSTAWAEHEQAAVWVAKFYLKDVRIAA